VTGFKKCRDETVKFLMSKNGNDSMDSEGMTLVAHLQENLQTLCSGTLGLCSDTIGMITLIRRSVILGKCIFP